MRRIRLKPEYLPLVADGRKRSTVRAGLVDIEPGAAEVVSGLSTLSVQVTGVVVKRLDELEEDDARTDGFANLVELQQALRRFYPDLSDKDPVSIVYFGSVAGGR